jgi:urease accessory protein
MNAVLEGAAQALAPTNLLAMVALGLIAGQHARQTPRVILAIFAAGLLAGSALIALALREATAPIALLVLAAVAGLLVAIGWKPPALARHALAFAIGVAIALNAPPQAVTIPQAVASQAGTAVAALVVLCLAIIAAMKTEHGWQQIAIRIAGSWIAASAILVLASRLFR